MSKIIIDEKICLKHKMTLSEALIALAIRDTDAYSEIPNMINRQLLVEDTTEDWYKVTKQGSETLDKILKEASNDQSEERLRDLASEMRKLYPEGRMRDKKTGLPTSYYFKCNTPEIAKKLKTFFERYGNYSNEDVLDATKRYVASFQGNYQQKGFRLLKYFIFKDDVKLGPDGNYVEPLSPLLDFLENKEAADEEPLREDWLTKLV